MFLDLRDFFIILDSMSKKVTAAEKELDDLSTMIGKNLRTKDPVRLITGATSILQNSIENVRPDYEKLKAELKYIADQLEKSHFELEEARIEAGKKGKKGKPLVRLVDSYESTFFGRNIYHNEVEMRLRPALQDLSHLLGRIKGISGILSVYLEAPLTAEELEELQRSISEITRRYIW